MTDQYRVPLFNQGFRRVLRIFFKIVFKGLGKVSRHGYERIPASGPYIITANHVSLLETPLLGAFWPHFPEIIGAAEVWDRPGQAFFAKTYHGIPVRRGEYDRGAIEAVLRVLKAGKILLIMPEGGRSHTPGMRRGKPGVAYIAERARVPIVPVGLVGTTMDFLKKGLRGQRPLIEIRVGEPFILSPIEGRGEARREARQRNADIVMAHIARQLPPEYRGVYEDYERYLV